MYRAAAMAMLFLLPTLSIAAKTPDLSGAEGCRLVNTTGQAGAKATWKGACRDGRAEGRGIVEWHNWKNQLLVHFDGDIKAGLMHGDGYQRLEDGTQYEGNFAEGVFHGAGTLVNMLGRYDGQFAGGKRNGRGKMVYLTGSRYDGQWLDGTYHGTGTALYPSGREVTAEWVNGIRADLVRPPPPDTKYALTVKNRGSKSYSDIAYGDNVPFEKSYSEMSEADKQLIHSAFALIDDGDEPPYPLEGKKPLYVMFREGLKHINNYKEGSLTVYAHVDAQGNPTKATVLTAPTDDLANLAMVIVLKQKFKPALCAGKPCGMKFPLHLQIIDPE
jgi:hypothetical protein